MHRQRNVFVILLGLGGLFAITMLGSSLEAFLPHRPAAAEQVTQAGPYQVTLLVSPNPPHITGLAELTVQIVKKDSRQLVTNATVMVEKPY